MNLEHLSSKLRLDIDHLAYQARTQHLSQAQYRQRFDSLARGYCSLVGEDDLPKVQQLVQRYEQRLSL
ncbi:hypothetical protein [Motiliproteus sp. SC1-56]|uniref:hypothetical protein n=1 Tax=Motiliproteus sp. SC1-56 TaxID=2799565 RepID=UPI001A90AB4F|nr:hypothetical protein [Motiliproteus sp. SC1-56]